MPLSILSLLDLDRRYLFVAFSTPASDFCSFCLRIDWFRVPTSESLVRHGDNVLLVEEVGWVTTDEVAVNDLEKNKMTKMRREEKRRDVDVIRLWFRGSPVHACHLAHS
jgi:hypothetical protein